MNLIVMPIVIALAATILETDDGWGQAQNGLMSRLSLVTKEPALGLPLRVRLEVKNVGSAPGRYDSQQSAINHAFQVTGPDGKEVPFIGGTYQTTGGPKPLGPGEVKTVIGDLDLSSQYLIEQAGEYTIQSRARGGIPTSNVLRVQVKQGALTEFQRLFGALHRSTPAGWRAANYDGSIVFLHAPTQLKADSTSITLFFTSAPTGGPKPMPGQPTPINLGESTLGHAWLSAESQTAVKRWPDYEKSVREKIKPFLKAGRIEP